MITVQKNRRNGKLDAARILKTVYLKSLLVLQWFLLKFVATIGLQYHRVE